VATGTWAIAWKLPLSDGSAGTAAHPGPKLTIESVVMLGAGLAPMEGAEPVSDVESLPQAASEIEKIAAAVRAVNLVARMVRSSIVRTYIH
jgi:hypothetical protein